MADFQSSTGGLDSFNSTFSNRKTLTHLHIKMNRLPFSTRCRRCCSALNLNGNNPGTRSINVCLLLHHLSWWLLLLLIWLRRLLRRWLTCNKSRGIWRLNSLSWTPNNNPPLYGGSIRGPGCCKTRG